MKGISCNSNFLSNMPVVQAIDVLAGEGYQAIDICMELAFPSVPVPTPHLVPSDDTATRNKVRRHAEQAGIAIAAMNAHTNICARDPEVRKANKQHLEGAVQMAADLGAPFVVTTGGNKDAYGYEQWYWDWTVELLGEVLPLAEKLGITLAIEAGSPSGCLIWNLELISKLLATKGLESIRVLFDPAHYHLRGDDPVQAVKTLGRQIVHVHAKDAAGNPENIVFPPLGEGEIDFDPLFKALANSGFDGYIAMEYEAFAWDFSKDQHKVLLESKAFLDGLVSKYWS